MNAHDSEKMAGMLKAEGYSPAESSDDADIVIFNTCSIRQKAEQKFFSELGRLKALKKRKPGMKIAVAGCVAQQEGENVFKRASHVDFVFGPQNLHRVREIAHSSNCFVAVEDNPSLANMEFSADRKDPIRAWINIVYGCNNFCSYCIVPHTRGREKSRAAVDILQEIKGLAERGYKEVTLLGQNVNSYCSSMEFPELLTEIDRIEGLERIRFVTSHPKDISPSLVFALRDLEKVCEHIHLPLQSGSTDILTKMNRKYSYDEYKAKVTMLRKEIPGIAITSDIIAGFPQETDADHALTVKALKELEFDGIFAFKYSSRSGTRAADMQGHVQDKVRAERLNEIIEVQNKITDYKNKELQGTLQEVLVEGYSDKDSGLFIGRNRANKIILFPVHLSLKPGDTVLVLIDNAHRHSLEGRVESIIT